jgi:hypothetical protein
MEARIFSLGKLGCTGSPLIARLGWGWCCPTTLCREVRDIRPWTRSRGRFVERGERRRSCAGAASRCSFFVLREFKAISVAAGSQKS